MGRDILDTVAKLKASGEPFALAAVVRTVSVTSVAKAGAKAVFRLDGTLSMAGSAAAARAARF